MTNFNASTMDCIEAMRVQEDTTIRCCNYFHRTKAGKDVDESSRKAMIEWCQQVQKSLNFSPETVWIAISFFDRYLSSGKGKSGEALDDRYKFQLAAISAFYVAIKIHEPVELNADTLVRL